MLLDPRAATWRPRAAEVLARARRRPALQARAARGAARDRDRGAAIASPSWSASWRAPARTSRPPRRTSVPPPPACIPSQPPRASSTSALATSTPRASTARSRGASSSMPSRSTSRPVRPTGRWRSTTRLRSYLPELAALAANAPFHDGRDTGLASVRPKISEMLPRQGVPPILAELGRLRRRAALGNRRRGPAGGRLPGGGSCARIRAFGTLELRVPDAQTTVGEAAAIAALRPGARRLARRPP